ncbi:MAG TPA: hypothetical protein VFT64_11900 [Rickettsiales bacterium]|nr:hypothetical protein [Rickettsiales bacterium]
MKSPIRYTKVAAPQAPAKNAPPQQVKPAVNKTSTVKGTASDNTQNKKK